MPDRRGLVVVMHGWQSRPTDGQKGGAVVFGMVAVVTSPTCSCSRGMVVVVLLLMVVVAAVVVVVIVEGSLEVKLPTMWTDEKHSQEEAEPGRNSDV